jgi:hypothetical protein
MAALESPALFITGPTVSEASLPAPIARLAAAAAL